MFGCCLDQLKWLELRQGTMNVLHALRKEVLQSFQNKSREVEGGLPITVYYNLLQTLSFNSP